MPGADAEIPLAGGLGSGGLVVRIGDRVHRPLRPWSASVAALLNHLQAVGFDGAPRFVGIDDRNREILTFVDGDVGIEPFPDWVASDDLLVSVAQLQRAMHEAARSFVIPADAVWDQANQPPIVPAGAIVCHNDLCVENVVVRDGLAVGFIDFDFASPVDPLFDIAVACRHWVPFKDPIDIADARRGLDLVARFHRFCDASELGRDERSAVVRYAGEFLDRAMVTMRTRADEHAHYQAVWDGGYPLHNRRSRAWLDAHIDTLSG